MDILRAMARGGYSSSHLFEEALLAPTAQLATAADTAVLDALHRADIRRRFEHAVRTPQLQEWIDKRLDGPEMAEHMRSRDTSIHIYRTAQGVALGFAVVFQRGPVAQLRRLACAEAMSQEMIEQLVQAAIRQAKSMGATEMSAHVTHPGDSDHLWAQLGFDYSVKAMHDPDLGLLHEIWQRTI